MGLDSKLLLCTCVFLGTQCDVSFGFGLRFIPNGVVFTQVVTTMSRCRVSFFQAERNVSPKRAHVAASSRSSTNPAWRGRLHFPTERGVTVSPMWAPEAQRHVATAFAAPRPPMQEGSLPTGFHSANVEHNSQTNVKICGRNGAAQTSGIAGHISDVGHDGVGRAIEEASLERATLPKHHYTLRLALEETMSASAEGTISKDKLHDSDRCLPEANG